MKNPNFRASDRNRDAGATRSREARVGHESVLPPLLLRAAQAAAYCGVSEATWWRWDSAGRIPRGRKVSRGVKVWSRVELEEWAGLGLPTRSEFEARAVQRNGQAR